MERTRIDAAYKVSHARNSGEAYRQFRSAGLIAGAHEMVVVVLRHRAFGALVALMGTAGLVGTFITFWPR